MHRNHRSFIVPLLCLLGIPAFYVCPAHSAALTEPDVVVRALRNNTSIRVSFIQRTTDSLSLESARAARLPTLDVSSTSSYAPGDSARLSTGLEAQATQSIPGGGAVSASVHPSRARELETDSTSKSTSYSLALTQPLLRDAWRNDPVAYGIRVAALDDQVSGLELRRDLAADLSRIRGLYWSCYEKKQALAISRDALVRAAKVLEKEQVRYRIGEAAAIDTLSATLEHLKAMQSVLSDSVALTLVRNELARALMFPADSVIVPDSIDVALTDLPPAEELIASVKEYDPQLRIFELLQEKLTLQLRNNRNELLPQVDLSASYSYNDALGDNDGLLDNSVISLILSYSLPTKARRIDGARTQLSLRRNDLQTAEREFELHNSVEELINNWAIERQKLAVSATSRDVARKYLESATKGLDVGTVDNLTYLNAQEDYVTEAVRYLQQQITLKRLEIVFDEITGSVLSRFGVVIQ